MKKILNKYKKAIIPLILIIVLFSAALLFREDDAGQRPTPVPQVIVREDSPKENVWADLIPGSSVDATASPSVGSLTSTQDYNETHMKFTYNFEGTNLPVYVYSQDQIGVIDYIDIPLLSSRNGHLFDLYEENNLGTPDLELFVTAEYNQKLYVFLDEGLAFQANATSGALVRRMYFAPTTREQFINFWNEEDFSLVEEFHGY